eukprot:CAMPEP_0177249774 /NCGR_PEP_ID=MMETSP0367-20130122/52957_1 /TAXON_ID=447022 ORGANISM="Scrippsiella hangoei-like, Strain SHHI-4" /NCGR_SAMPLE_ID=MMETSP0367 /ASSEMBLY_ACC=CAM_ASM_000362 /LENGTH=222 /DNA_ID=CAMNT_0018702353 /DNA_START=66 /DNA_END=734 /DNA_ORIENTATION=-
MYRHSGLALLLFGGAATADSKPVFDYTFASNCPVCKSFGNTTLKALYGADGIADAVDFQVHAGVRMGLFKDYECVLEKPGCPMTRYMLCALDTKPANIMAYLNCWNEAAVIRWPYTGVASRAQACAERSEIDWQLISACISSDHGDQLMEREATYFTERFPDFAHAGPGKPFGVPHVYIDGEEMGAKGWAEKVPYDGYVHKLCGTGIKAAACHSPETAQVVV